MDGLAAAAALRTAIPACRVLIVTTFGRPGYLRQAMEAGAMGFVLKDAPASQLASAIRQVAAGRRVVDPALALDALSEGTNPLSEREREVLVASTEQATVADIAAGHDPQRGNRSQPPVGGDPEGRRAQPSRGRPHRARQGLARPAALNACRTVLSHRPANVSATLARVARQ